MVVNIVVGFNADVMEFRFVGLDGNGVDVLRGGFSREIFGKDAIWEGEFSIGRIRITTENRLDWREYYSDAKNYDLKFMRELFAREKSITVNKIIEL